MVIFGAGSSYDSVNDDGLRVSRDANYRPPLANELFADRPQPMGQNLDRYPAVRAVASEVRAATGIRDVEDILAGYQARASEERVARQLLSTRYYLQQVLLSCGQSWYKQHQGVTNYGFLLELLEREQPESVLLVTFNYDQLLEYALKDILGMDFDGMDRYVDGRYKLVKAHGSVNWGRVLGARTDGYVNPEVEILRASSVRVLEGVTDEYVIATGSADAEGNLAIPAIAVPLRAKDAFECPGFHQRVLEEQLGAVSRVLIVGWRGGEQKFVDLMANRLRVGLPIGVVSKPDGVQETRANLHSGGVTGDYRYCDTGFSGLIKLGAALGRLPSHEELTEYEALLGASSG